jgi:hypothetical protein
MYYIPGAQKNVYLKEVSVLVKAIRKTGGMGAIEHAPELNVVRNLLLDWVTAGLGETGPEAVARMIKLEVKQAQAIPAAATGAPIELGAIAGRTISRVMTFSVLVAPPNGTFALVQDPGWGTAMEKEADLDKRLASGAPFMIAGRQVFVTATAAYPGGRVLYQCVALASAL